MKLFFRSFLLSIAGLFMMNSYSSAQGAKEMNETVFAEVKTLINSKKPDALYALLNDDFKAKFNKETFTGILNTNLYPLGAIKEYTFISFSDGVSAYKAVCNSAVLEFKIGTDPTGKIAHLRFLPYKEPATEKTFTVASSNPLVTALDKHVDAKARPYINKVNTVGLCIGIIKDNAATIYGYGETVKRNKKIPDAYSIFEIGSVTKTFTATLLAYYVSEGKVALSDPITKYLPDYVTANMELKAITLEMLSNHTSGLPRIPDNLLGGNTDMLNPYKSYDEKMLFSYLKNCKLQSEAGTQYAYSNLAAGLLGVILEHISGTTYEQMVIDIICKPLGMVNTKQHLNTDQIQAAVYNEKGEQVVMWDMDALAGAGALRSTVHDMLKYVQANMNEDNSSLSKAIQLTHKVTYHKEMSVGLGWHLDEISGTTYYWHNGGTGGSRSFVAFMPDKKIAVVVLSNCAEDADDVGKSILKGLQ